MNPTFSHNEFSVTCCYIKNGESSKKRLFVMWHIYANKKNKPVVMEKNMENTNLYLLVSNGNNIKAGNLTLIYY